MGQPAGLSKKEELALLSLSSWFLRHSSMLASALHRQRRVPGTLVDGRGARILASALWIGGRGRARHAGVPRIGLAARALTRGRRRPGLARRSLVLRQRDAARSDEDGH